MSNSILLDVLAIILGLVHFGIPLAYYYYLKKRYLNKPWNIKIDENYKPKVTIIIPTYNEARLIQSKLDNIYSQDYPRELIEVIVVDSNSSDGTVELVEEWAFRHRDVNLKIIREPIRRGMVPALNYALQNYQVSGEIVVFTDVDAFWNFDALRNIVKYFADSTVGAVTASIMPVTQSNSSLEETYRNYYNTLRIAESKVHSTPVHNGPLIAFRTNLLYRIGGLPEFTGNNDSTPASIMAFMGYRAIQVDDVIVREPLRKEQFYRKVRRAQHLLLSFLKTKQYAKKLGVYKYVKPFERIWKVEWWLHVVNPWLLFSFIVLLVLSTLHGSLLAPPLLGTGLLLLVSKTSRVWILQQAYLIIATIRNLWTREIMWSK